MNLPIRNYLCIKPLTMYAVISITKYNTKVRKYGMDQLVGSGIGFEALGAGVTHKSEGRVVYLFVGRYYAGIVSARMFI